MSNLLFLIAFFINFVGIPQSLTFLLAFAQWRNPERNERVDGVKYSKHQLGSAIDIVVFTVPDKSPAQLFCILQTAAKSIPGHKAFAEHNSSQVPCQTTTASNRVTHVHTQSK